MLTCIILILTCINQVLRYFGSDSRTPIYNYYLMKLCLHLGENQNNFLCSFNHFFIYVATNPKVLRTFTGKRKSKEKLRKEKNLRIWFSMTTTDLFESNVRLANRIVRSEEED
jgi:hypothetical protein